MMAYSKLKKRNAEKTVRATRRNYSAEENLIIGTMGKEIAASALCKKGINQNLYYRWSKEFLEAGKKRLAGDTSL